MKDLKKINKSANSENNPIGNLTDHLPVGIYRTTPEGKIIYANPALANMLGYSPKEIMNITVSDLYPNREERETEIKLLTKNSETSSSRQICLKKKDGSTITVRDTVTVVKDNQNNLICFDGILEDITAKIRAEEDLKESQAKYKILTELTIEGIIIHDNGIIIDTNTSLQKMMGYSEEYLKGRNIFEFIHTDSKELVKRNVENHFSGTYEIKLIQNNSIITAEVEVNNVLIDNKEYRVVAVRDITSKKNIEKEILLYQLP